MRTCLFLSALALASTATAVPLSLNHQGRLLDSTGVALEGSHTLSVSLHDAPSGGAVVWSETTDATLDQGYYALPLGADSSNALDTDDFGDALWVSIAVDGGPASDRFPLHSSPYAIVAERAVSLSGGAVDATSISVNGTEIVGADGRLAVSGLSTLSCSDGQVAKFNSGDWACAADDTLTEGDVISLVEGTSLNLDASTTINGQSIVTGGGYTDADVQAFIEATGLTLDTGTTLGGDTLATDAELSQALDGVATEDKQDAISADLGSLDAKVDGMDSKLDDVAAVCSDRPVYTKTCSDWSDKGWNDVDECLTDGRWHLYATWVNGGVTESGGGVGRVMFHAASVAGADTKMRIGREWYEVSIRSNDANSAFWVFNKEKSKHMSFHMRSNGVVDSYHLSTNDSGYHSNWQGTDLGNWHYMQHNYSSQGSLNTSSNGGIGVWARY